MACESTGEDQGLYSPLPPFVLIYRPASVSEFNTPTVKPICTCSFCVIPASDYHLAADQVYHAVAKKGTTSAVAITFPGFGIGNSEAIPSIEFDIHQKPPYGYY